MDEREGEAAEVAAEDGEVDELVNSKSWVRRSGRSQAGRAVKFRRTVTINLRIRFRPDKNAASSSEEAAAWLVDHPSTSL